MKKNLYSEPIFVVIFGATLILLNSFSLYADSEDALIDKARIALQQGDAAMNQAHTLQSTTTVPDSRKQPPPSKAEVQALKAKAAEAKERYNAKLEERQKVLKNFGDSRIKLQERKEEEALALEQWLLYRGRIPPDLSPEATAARKAFENASAALHNTEREYNELSSTIKSLDREIPKLEATWNQLRQEARQAEKARWMATGSPLRDTAEDAKSRTYKEARKAYEQAERYALEAYREISRKAQKLNQDYEKATANFNEANKLWFESHKAYSSSLFAHPFNERRTKELNNKMMSAEKERLEAQKRHQAASEKVAIFQSETKLRECDTLIKEAGRKLSSAVQPTP